jgi:23S rRNA (uracil1939-C5)-methyltransferase
VSADHRRTRGSRPRGRPAREGEPAQGASGRGESTASPEDVATIAIDTIAAGGDGVGRAGALACFVPRTAPGDVVQVALQRRRRFATGRVLQLLTPSTLREEPRCRHYVADRCGGCQLQHLTGDAQRTARRTIVRDALLRIARRSVELPEIVQGPAEWEYRRRLTLTLRRRGTRWIGGLHPHDDPVRVFALEECPITQPALVRAWHGVRLHDRALPDVPVLRLAFRLLDDERVAIVVIGGDEWPAASAWGEVVLRENGEVREVWWERATGSRLLLASRQRASDAVADELPASGDHAESLAFVQINTAVAALLREHVLDAVMAFSPRHVLDAYSGSGLLTAGLVARDIRVTAIEVDAAATARARQRIGDAATAAIITAAVEQALPTALRTDIDVVVVNPPRRGLEPGLPARLDEACASGVRGIVYVSCDPATLARDLGLMPSWRLASTTCFDMFPQTAHVETVCVLVPEPA